MRYVRNEKRYAETKLQRSVNAVWRREAVSRRMVTMVAMQGRYRRTNTRKESAEAGVKKPLC